MSDPAGASGAWRDASSWRSPTAGGNPPSSTWRQRNNPTNSSSGQRNNSGRPGDRPARGGQDDSATAAAIAEGRRIYLGNLVYTAKVEDVEALLEEHGCKGADYKNTHISVDPFSGRNPGYCFVEFATKESADAAMAGLEGMPLFDRPVKCRPCLPKGAPRRTDSDGNSPSGQNGDRYERRSDRTPREGGAGRWGSWGERDSGRSSFANNNSYRERSKAQEEGRQVYVGGLPRMLDQSENDVEMRGLFNGFEVEVVSKRISPKTPSAPGTDERRNFCFVDFASADQAQAAVNALDGSEHSGGNIKVSIAVPRTERAPAQSYQS
ncbi:RNA recognition domain-containing protein [Apiospora marii]|uniref:RNA recognition domain-containing protein n=1 Tax=Apiospora marii TaxID=335849 RepID=A0ABR1RKT5_9PEZI